MNISGIYKIKNKVNGEYYIGSSVDIHKRWKQHIENIVKAITGKSKNYNGSRNGQNNPHSKLTLEQVQEIKKLFNLQQGKYNMYKKLANQFNVSWGTIRNVVEGITYAS